MFLMYLCVALMCAWICFHHYHMYQSFSGMVENEHRIIHRVKRHSQVASSTNRPLTSLIEVTRALTLLEMLQERVGEPELNQRLKTNTTEMHRVLVTQQQTVVRDVGVAFPGIIPEHPFNDRL